MRTHPVRPPAQRSGHDRPTLRDTETKRGLYARAGVPSYWIVVPDEENGEMSRKWTRLLELSA
jgi:Uma2 family endonuclease